MAVVAVVEVGGGLGGGNHWWRERRARSDDTCRRWERSALEPTIYVIKSVGQFFLSSMGILISW